MAAAAISLSTNQTREQYRAEHKVRLISPEEDGRGFTKLPAGVYGFTYAPATETPLFAKDGYGAYEVHKLPDGDGRLIVYVTAEQAAALASCPDLLNIDVYPAPFEASIVSFALPMEWITNGVYKVVRREGNPVSLKVSAL